MQKKILSVVMVAILSCSSAWACDVDGQGGFAPKNDLYIGVDDKAVSDITEEMFSAIIDRVASFYSPIVKSKGGILTMMKNWNDGEVNASASRDFSNNKIWKVSMYGGLARHPLMTSDGFMMVVCHELGHHIGGAPHKGRTSWVANEGQSDYFASTKCLRRVLEKEDNIDAVSKMTVEPVVTAKCQMAHKTANDIAICQRTAMAAKNLAQILSGLDERSTVSHKTPDMKVVSVTNDNHPEAQCRLDTYFQGALCDKSFTDDVNDNDPIPGTCIKRDGYTVGVRPLCWYKPGANEI